MVIRERRDLGIFAVGFAFGVSVSIMLHWYLSITYETCHTWPKNCENGHDDQESEIEGHKTYVESRISVAVHKKYSCNETFSKSKGNPVEFRSFKVQKCSNPAENETTTLIISHPVTENLAFLDIIQTALVKFAKVILVAFRSEIKLVTKSDWYSKWIGVRFFTVAVESVGTYGDAMNKAIDLVTTPLILVAPRLAYLNFDIIGQKLDVQRLIRMLETMQNVGVVGGAVKDVSNQVIRFIFQI